MLRRTALQGSWLALFICVGILSAGAGCSSSSGSSSSPVQAITAAPLVAAPASVSVGSGFPAQVLVTGLHGAPTITIADQTLADVSPPVVNGSAAAFTVSQVAGGHSTISVSDPTGASVTIPVTTQLCVPPTPAITMLGANVVLATPTPAPGTAIPPSGNGTTIFFSSPNQTPWNQAGLWSQMRVRLIGSDRSILYGGPIYPVSQLTPPPTPVPISSTSAEWYSGVVPLPKGLSYQVQLVGEACAPADVLGSFSS